MRSNPLRERWAAGEAAIGGWLNMPNAFSAEIVARCDFDYVCVDTQHGFNDHLNIWKMLQAVNLGSATPLVRVLQNESGLIGKSLDAGARGIIVPMVNTRAEAEATVRACRYAPDGARSYGPARALRQEGADYHANANADVAVIPMIETTEAIENLDDILSVPGLDAVYVGPSDLSLTLGLPPGNNDGNPLFDDALATIAAGCERHGVVAGCHTSAELCQRRIEQGFRMVTVTSDLIALTRALDDELRRARGEDPVVRSGSLY
jgi:4-hydroxy-2-oxoheptanedioate aldolase